MWTAARYIGNEPSDGGRARIPNLSYTGPDDLPSVARDNPTKSRVLLASFFPAPPENYEEPPTTDCVQPVKDLPELTGNNISSAISAPKPFKAPGPDGLPCVYIFGAELLVDHLLPIFRASLRLGIYPASWKQSRTAVLCKPGKPSYTVAKSYRPIALLNVASKILSSCIAKRLTSLANTHGWLPDHHFGGRSGRTATDALHLLTKTVKDAWARSPGGQVASALFLDVKGAFPHALPSRLAVNMKKLGRQEQQGIKLTLRSNLPKFDLIRKEDGKNTTPHRPFELATPPD